VSTAILLFTKTNSGGTDHVWFYDVTADGWSLDDKRTPLLPEARLGTRPAAALTEEEHARNNPLHSLIRGMSVENFLVRPHRRLVETYSDLDRWRRLTPEAAEEIGNLAGLPSRERDDEAAKRFDLLVLRLQFARLTSDPGYPRLCQQVREIASALLAQTNIPAIRERRELLEAVAGTDWWQDVTLPMLELLRRRARSLVRLIERSKRALVFTDFTDQLGEITELELAGFPAGTDLARFRAKVQVYLHDHEDHLAVQKLHRNRQLSPTDLAELERILAECGGEPEVAEARRSASGLGLFIRGLVGLDREAAKEAFGEFLAGRRFTADQIHFVDMIINQLTESGTMEPARLYEPPFTDLAPHGPESLFPAVDVERLVTVLRRVQETAEPPLWRLSCDRPRQYRFPDREPQLQSES
jgi:type I restriction enzyme R subunit